MLLVALDLEGCAAQVLECAGQLAFELGEELELLTAATVPGGVPDAEVLPGHEMSAHDEVAAEACTLMQALAQPWADKGVPLHYSVRFGKPHDVICARVDELRPRMLVLGTHARTGLKRMIFGSVEESVVRDVDLPVVVVPVKGAGHHGTATLDALRAEGDG